VKTRKPLTLSLPEIITHTAGDMREPTLRAIGLTSDDVRLVLKVLDENGITYCPGKRKRRRLTQSLSLSTQLAMEIPFDELYKEWTAQRRGTHERRGRGLLPNERVRIANDEFYYGAVFPAYQVLTSPEKVFTKEELQRGEGYGEFDVGATATVIETGDVYIYNGYRWVKQ